MKNTAFKNIIDLEGNDIMVPMHFDFLTEIKKDDDRVNTFHVIESEMHQTRYHIPHNFYKSICQFDV